MVTLAMGDYGKISRVFGNCFGSDITFAKGIKESAPGQMDIKVIRKIWKEIL
jgi:3-dehydroquinate dehydratase-1